MKKLNNIINFLSDTISGEAMGWLAIAMMILVFIEAISRYVLQHPLRISDEFSAYMLVAIVFVGAAYTWKEKEHVRIEVFSQLLPKKVSRWIRCILLGIAVIYMPILINSAWYVTNYSRQFGLRSSTWIRTPEWYIQVFIILGFTLLFFQVLFEFIKTVRDIRAGDGVQQ